MNGRPYLNLNEVSAKDFMTSELRKTSGNVSTKPLGVSTIAATSLNMLGLNTLGLMMVRIDMDVGGLFPPHVHARATECHVYVNFKLLLMCIDVLLLCIDELLLNV